MNWTEPSVSDNSTNVTVRQIKGPTSGSSFRVGITEIRYTATELNGTESPDCVFFVVVEGKAYVTLLSFLRTLHVYLPRQKYIARITHVYER